MLVLTSLFWCLLFMQLLTIVEEAKTVQIAHGSLSIGLHEVLHRSRIRHFDGELTTSLIFHQECNGFVGRCR